MARILTLLVVVVVGGISALVWQVRAPRRASSSGDPDHDVDEDVVAAAPPGAVVRADLLLPIPDQLLLVPRSIVVLGDSPTADGDDGPGTGPVDLDATARARAWCGVEAAGWPAATDDPSFR